VSLTPEESQRIPESLRTKLRAEFRDESRAERMRIGMIYFFRGARHCFLWRRRLYALKELRPADGPP
jgi:hypothetical protein